MLNINAICAHIGDNSLHIMLMIELYKNSSKKSSYVHSHNLGNILNFQFLATNDVIYTQPRIYESQRIILGERNNAETTCNRDHSSPRLHVEMYPIRYTSPTNMAKERRIEEEKDEEDEEVEEEEDENDQENECASRVTRF